MSLSDTAIRKAKPADKPQKLRDGGGLYLLLRPDGARWWRWDYRRPVTGKRNTLSLGTYPDTGLAEARERHAEARKMLAAGVDPGEQRKAAAKADQAAAAARADQVANSFEAVAREWLAMRDWVPRYQVKVEAWMANDVFPYIGHLPVAEVTAPEVLEVLRRVESRGALESAHRIGQNCGQVFRYAIATGRAERNPTPDLRGALKSAPDRHLAAMTEPDQVAPLLRALYGYQGTPAVMAALKLAPLVFVRPGELRQARWADIDLEAGEWRFTASKTGQPHIVPLASQAVAILADLQPLTGRGEYVFPSARGKGRPMSEAAVTAALQRMGFDGQTMTGHGFRAMARTMLDELLGFRPDFIEHQLAHLVRDPNGRAYNRTQFLRERATMMQAWADYLDTLRTGGNVVPISLRRRG